MESSTTNHGMEGDADSESLVNTANKTKVKAEGHMVPWVYDLMLWSLSILVDLFFREVHPRGAWKIPLHDPILFVAAPHANQFVDSLILMRLAKTEAKRRIAFLIAEKSMRQKGIGTFAKAAGSIPVARAQDSMKPGQGRIYLPHPTNDINLVKGVNTNFEAQLSAGATLQLPTVGTITATAEVDRILGPEELRLKREFQGSVPMEQLTGRKNFDKEGPRLSSNDFQGSTYKYAAKVDQNKVYDAVFERLAEGGCVGIFPEGGSHDRPELLPLKAGVALMALGTVHRCPNLPLKIVPVGMNYFHAHKFRSRAVVEFGTPIEIPAELVEIFGQGDRRRATGALLRTIYESLVSVTVPSSDYETSNVIAAARRLYNPKGKQLPLSMVVELSRRMEKGYKHYQEDPRIMNLHKSVGAYDKQLRALGIKDHQVQYAKFPWWWVFLILLYRLGKLLVLTSAVLPGLLLFTPIFVASKLISIKKSRQALAASTVKLEGRDVIATWKLLVALAFAPLLYTWYTFILTFWTYYNRVQGYVPGWVSLWMVVIFGYTISISITFASLRFGEIGMDIVKSLPPLVLCLRTSSANTLSKLRTTREQLRVEVTDIINTLGPEMYPDFDANRVIADPLRQPTTPRTPGGTMSTATPPQRDRAQSGTNNLSTTRPHGPLPRNESFKNFGNIPLFASRPQSRNHSRKNSMAAHLAEGQDGGSSTIDSKQSLDEVSQKIRGAMRERGKQRRRKSLGDSGGSGNSWDFAETSSTGGTSTPASVDGEAKEGKKGL